MTKEEAFKEWIGDFHYEEDVQDAFFNGFKLGRNYSYYVVILTDTKHTCFTTSVPYRLDSESGLERFQAELKMQYGPCIILWWKRLEED